MKIFLVIAYISYLGEPSIKVHEMPSLEECNTTAKQVFKQVQAGSARVWCHRIG